MTTLKLNVDLAGLVESSLDKRNRFKPPAEYVANSVRQGLTALAYYHQQGDNDAFDKAVKVMCIDVVDPATLPKGCFSFAPTEPPKGA